MQIAYYRGDHTPGVLQVWSLAILSIALLIDDTIIHIR
jgi:hypothetical protein